MNFALYRELLAVANQAAPAGGHGCPHTALRGRGPADPAHRPGPRARLRRRRGSGRRDDHRHRRRRTMARPARRHRWPAPGTDPVGRRRSCHLVRRAACVLRAPAASGVRGRPLDAANLQRCAPVPGRPRHRGAAAHRLRPRRHLHRTGLHDRPRCRRPRRHRRILGPGADHRRHRHLGVRAVPDVVQPADPQRGARPRVRRRVRRGVRSSPAGGRRSRRRRRCTGPPAGSRS